MLAFLIFLSALIIISFCLLFVFIVLYETKKADLDILEYCKGCKFAGCPALYLSEGDEHFYSRYCTNENCQTNRHPRLRVRTALNYICQGHYLEKISDEPISQ